VSNRIGIAEGDDPLRVEEQLCVRLPPAQWTLASDVQILHGRRICRPKPLCDQCSVRDDCDFYRNVVAREGAGAATKSAKNPATKNTKTTKAGPAADVRPAGLRSRPPSHRTKR
jgi:hypothetical protein